MSRHEYAQAATRFYMRRYWIFYVLAMAVGLGLIIWNRDSFGVVIGIILMLYPLTVPMRYANAIGLRARTFMDQDLTYDVHPERVEIRNDAGGITTAQFANARAVEVIGNMIVMLYGRAHFLVLPLTPLEPDERTEFVVRARARGLKPPA